MRCRTVLFGVIFLAELSSWAAAQTCETFNNCADQDGDLIRDDNCVWWGCTDGQCSGVDILFADMNGDPTTCEPDGFVGAYDSTYGALRCFENTGYGAAYNEGFPCESNPPQALNVDAGGRFRSCQWDGVCDIHDFFHAINAFLDTNSCFCPLDSQGGTVPPAPLGSPQVRVFMASDGNQSTAPSSGNTTIIMDAGSTATVMVWAEVSGSEGEASLQAYQVMLESGATPAVGVGGSVSYVDVDPGDVGGDSLNVDKQRPDWIFAGAPAADGLAAHYSETQMGFCGLIYNYLTGSGITPAEGIHYLASFDIQASADAFGEFELRFVRETIPGLPRPWSDLVQPWGFEYPVEEWQSLTILVGTTQCNDSTGCGEVADQNSDGIRDDGCVWWGCDAGLCAPVDLVFGDMGSANGACVPDGAADANDRFHALNCFSDQSTTGQSGYPCEANPPAALNVDAGGAFGDCAPDGVCDGNDAFHALNAFSGETACSCPAGGPAPSGPAVVKDTLVRGGRPPVLDSAEIALVAGRRTVRPGELVDIDVVLGSPVADLRGYQLHLGTSGGKSGALKLVDISIRQPSVFTTPNDGAGLEPTWAGLKPAPTNQDAATAPAIATAPTSAATAATVPTSPVAPTSPIAQTAAWSAFNPATQQMLAGLDGPGVAAPAGGYLATFTYRASADAAGTFTVELLHDAVDRSQRTFLFPTAVSGGIDIRGEASVTVNVAAARDRR